MITIYALRDPRNDEVRYVGQAADVARRYQQHQRTRYLHGGVLCYFWRDRLHTLGLQPQLQILETVATTDKAVAFVRERAWIAHYLAQGHDVLNGPGGRYNRFTEGNRAVWLLTETVAPGELVGQRPEITALFPPKEQP